jgi:N6-adenosine-specific RNA methylase IME4
MLTLEELSPRDLHWGMGYSSRANAEVVLLATRGAPMRLNNDVHQIVLAPAMAHSDKPEEVRRRIERLYPDLISNCSAASRSTIGWCGATKLIPQICSRR